MALKQHVFYKNNTASFGSIRNNMALKPADIMAIYVNCFGSIRNNMALKRTATQRLELISFGSIRNNMALKHVLRR